MEDGFAILHKLTMKYHKSKKDNGTNRINRRTFIRPDEIYAGYYDKFGDIKTCDAFDEAAEMDQKLGFIRIELDHNHDRIDKIVLVDDRVADIERYLEENCAGYEARGTRESRLKGLAQEYQGLCPLCDFECDRVLKDVDGHKTKKYDSKSWSYKDEKDLLEALKFIGRNKQNLYIREAAMEIFPSSKRLGGGEGKEGRDGDKLLRHICRVCMDFLGTSNDDYAMEDEVLQSFHIIKDRQKIGIKGNGTIIYEQDGRTMHVNLSPSGIELYVDELTEYKKIHIDTPFFMTVENHYSWARSEDKSVTYFDLLGFKDRTQREFLKAVYRDNPDINYMHFGDIDTSGFLIYEDLCASTGIPFEMYKMSVTELTDERYASNLRKLKEEESEKLEVLLDDPRIYDAATYMLEHNVKLEQEIISLTEWMDKH